MLQRLSLTIGKRKRGRAIFLEGEEDNDDVGMELIIKSVYDHTNHAHSDTTVSLESNDNNDHYNEVKVLYMF